MKYPLMTAIYLVFAMWCTSCSSIREQDMPNIVPSQLITKEPHPAADTLFSYLRGIYGQKTIAGQMDLSWNDSVHMVGRVYRDTGRYPALQGFDFMNFKGTGSGTVQTYEALQWWKNAAGTGKNGIVTFCWHWRDPRAPFDRGEFYTRDTSFRIPYDLKTRKWKTDTAEYQAMMKDISRVARELKKLQDKGVPVLWRPLHEASGGWFWWGASGSDAYKALWELLFDQLNGVHGLKNLIWVWNGQDKGWYPGNDTVDIIGEDVYPGPRKYNSGKSRFFLANRIGGGSKMVALTENGAIPDPDAMARDESRWLYFMTWNDAHGREHADDESSFWTGQYHNEDTHKKKVYHHPDVITLDELPSFVLQE
ncbi:MAG: hypothetical protein JXB03_07275 [Spirochaetales bacterium]|nr:hypothetical protein [Spirochaetales bacterium]